MSISDRHFELLVERALTLLPDEIKAYLHNVIVEIEDEADEETKRSLGLTPAEISSGESPYGLYEALLPEIDEYLTSSTLMTPHRIVIYKNPLMRDFQDRRQLMVEIRKTVVHEVYHRLGLTDDDLAPFDDHPNPFGPDSDQDSDHD